MVNTGILLFCITNELHQDIFKLAGMDGNGTLYAIENSGFYAIVGNVDLAQYGEEAMAEKGEDVDWLKEKAVMFMNIILKLSALSSIIPMKFLTIFKSEERVKDIISENHEQFTHNFTKINHRGELSVKIYCDEKKYKEKVMEDEIINFETSLVGKPKGAAFFLRKKFDGELDDKIRNRICNLANDFIDSIKSLATDMKSNKILTKEITEIATPMILNCAFLVDNEMQEQFNAKIDDLKVKGNYERDGFIIEVSGPWPPFSFCE